MPLTLQSPFFFALFLSAALCGSAWQMMSSFLGMSGYVTNKLLFISSAQWWRMLSNPPTYRMGIPPQPNSVNRK
jgi:hypothetical protein